MVVRDADEGRREIERLLDGRPATRPSSIERILPSLEDVFIHHVEEAEAARRGGAAGGAVRRLRAVVVKEVRQIRRDPFSLVMLIGLPAFMLVLYGFALNFDVRHVRLAVQDRDRSAASRELVASFTHSTYFDLVATPGPGADLEALRERRVARAVLVIPEGYGRDLAAGARRSVQLLLDGADSTTATTILGYARRARRRAERRDSWPRRSPPRAGGRPARPRARASSSTRSSSPRSSWCPASSASC